MPLDLHNKEVYMTNHSAMDAVRVRSLWSLLGDTDARNRRLVRWQPSPPDSSCKGRQVNPNLFSALITKAVGKSQQSVTLHLPESSQDDFLKRPHGGDLYKQRR